MAGAVRWSVSKSALDPHLLRDNLATTRRRAVFPLWLPSGVGIREMETVWHGLQFNPVAPVEVPFKAELFYPPPTSVKVLRRLSHKGRDYLEHTIRMLEGKPKPVLGLPNDAQEVAQLVALAHSDTSRKLSSAPGEGRRQVRSNVEAANQRASQRAVVPGRSTTIDADNQPSPIKGPTGRPQVRSFTTPFTEAGYGDNFVPKTTLRHLDEMLSEDQRRIVEDQDVLSAEARSRLTCPIHRRPVAAHSKSDHLIKELKKNLRGVNKIDRPERVAQENSEGTEHRQPLPVYHVATS
jgi:hypothetical protein